jgi:hypothetical protein
MNRTDQTTISQAPLIITSMDKYLQYKIWPPILFYMLIGVLLFEYSWHSVRKVRETDEARDIRYPAFRRWDAKNWARWKFYPGAVTIMPLRLILMILIGLICYLSVRIVTIGYKFDESRIMTGCRAKTVKALTNFFSSLLLAACCMRYTINKVDFDYTEYLGPEY